MKRLLYTLFIGVIASTIFLVISYNEKNKGSQVDSHKKYTYCLNELCIDLKSLNYDFSVIGYTNKLFSSNNSKEIKIGNDSIYVHIYENQNLLKEDANNIIKYGVELQYLLCQDRNPSFLYKKDRIIVHYNKHDENIKKALDSILGPAFLEVG